MHALKVENGNVTNNMAEIVRIRENFYAELYDSNARPKNIPYRTDFVSGEVPVITKDEIKKALIGMRRGRAAGEDGITVDLMKDGGVIVLEKPNASGNQRYQCCGKILT